MKEELTKSMKKQLRTLAGLAHSRELSSELSTLEAHFAQWRAGQLDAFDLSALIHGFHDGPARDLYKQYVLGDPSWSVAAAIERGILTEAEAGPAVVALLSPKTLRLR